METIIPLVYFVSRPFRPRGRVVRTRGRDINIHVLTQLAVRGTVALGCALEGALLLVLFSTVAFVEMQLTGRSGDLMSLWATVPGEVLVDVDAAGAPVAATEQVIPARDVRVGAHVFVRSEQQVRQRLSFSSFSAFSTRRGASDSATRARWRASGDPTPMTILSQERSYRSAQLATR